MPRKAAPPPFAFPTRPDPRVRAVWSIRGLVLALFYAIPIAFFLFFRTVMASQDSRSDAPFMDFLWQGIWLWLAVVGVVWVLVIFYANLAAARYTFEVGEEEVTVRKGVLFRTTSRIPLRRVQDIHVRQGPLLRAFGLASIKLETAGAAGPNRYGYMGLHSEGQLPGLRDAEIVAQQIMERVKRLKGDV